MTFPTENAVLRASCRVFRLATRGIDRPGSLDEALDLVGRLFPVARRGGRRVCHLSLVTFDGPCVVAVALAEVARQFEHVYALHEGGWWVSVGDEWLRRARRTNR